MSRQVTTKCTQVQQFQQVQQREKDVQMQQVQHMRKDIVSYSAESTSTKQGMMVKRSRSQSAVGQACAATFSSSLMPLSSKQSSQESISSSSESTSISEVSAHMKEYEDADTLERRDSVDQYLTARGDLSQSISVHVSESSSSTQVKSIKPVITFNPEERHKYRKASSKKSPAPKPKAGSVPPQSLSEREIVLPSSPSVQNVHSDMYSTVFALQSLGDGGTWPSYLNRVRNIWDDKLQKTSAGEGTPVSGTAEYSHGRIEGHARSDLGQYHA